MDGLVSIVLPGGSCEHVVEKAQNSNPQNVCQEQTVEKIRVSELNEFHKTYYEDPKKRIERRNLTASWIEKMRPGVRHPTVLTHRSRSVDPIHLQLLAA